MYDQTHRAAVESPGFRAASVLADGEHDRATNERIRRLLKHYGLRTSLIRLKVIDVLLAADRNHRPVGVRGLHTQLEELDVPLSFLSVREVLKRLSVEGVVTLESDKSYRLQPEALAMLEDNA